MNKMKLGLIIWTLVALIIGLFIGMLVTNVVTTGNAIDVFKSQKMSEEEFNKLLEENIITFTYTSDNYFKINIPEYINLRALPKDSEQAAANWECCLKGKWAIKYGPFYRCNEDSNCSIAR